MAYLSGVAGQLPPRRASGLARGSPGGCGTSWYTFGCRYGCICGSFWASLRVTYSAPWRGRARRSGCLRAAQVREGAVRGFRWPRVARQLQPGRPPGENRDPVLINTRRQIFVIYSRPRHRLYNRRHGVLRRVLVRVPHSLVGKNYIWPKLDLIVLYRDSVHIHVHALIPFHRSTPIRTNEYRIHDYMK